MTVSSYAQISSDISLICLMCAFLIILVKSFIASIFLHMNYQLNVWSGLIYVIMLLSFSSKGRTEWQKKPGFCLFMLFLLLVYNAFDNLFSSFNHFNFHHTDVVYKMYWYPIEYWNTCLL